MNVRFFLSLAALAALAAPTYSQTYERRAALTGGNANQGKCTIEVVVDGAAEVEVRGDTAVLRNVFGQPPEWRRFQCNAIMPANPPDFRFVGVDGRGNVQLVRDPRNGGVAVVRIDDPKPGTEGYTFDLIWNNRGFSPGPGRDSRDDRGNYPPPDRDRQFSGPSSTDGAIRMCQDAIRQQAVQTLRTDDIAFRRTALDDNAGRRDSILGAFDVRRRGDNRVETYRFSCSVDFDNGRLRSAQIEPLDNGGYRPGDNGRSSSSAAIQSCQRAVEDRLRSDGYPRVDFHSIRVDDRRNDSIIGDARAGDGNRYDSFDFSCSVDFNDGDVRSIDVRPRGDVTPR